MICTYMHVYECICMYMYVYVRSIPVQPEPLVEKDQQRGWLEQALRWPASHPVTVQPGHWVMGTAAGPLDTIMHSVPDPYGGQADSSSLESQPVMVRFQLEVHSGYDALSARRIQVHTMMPAAGNSVPFGPGCRFYFRNRRFPFLQFATMRTHDVAGLDYCILCSFS